MKIGFCIFMVGGGWELLTKYGMLILYSLWVFTLIFNVLKFGNYVHIKLIK